MSSDNSFGPQLGSSFDFTLLFDHTILGIFPNGLMILLAPFFIVYYRRQPEVILPSALLWFKMAAALALVGIQISNLVLWIAPADRHSEDSIAATIFACAGALFLAVFLHFEHRRSVQSSAFLAIWLTVTALFDGASARSYYRRSHLQDVASLTVAGAAIKAVLVVLEEWPKTHYVKDKETGKPVGRDTSSGFWNRALFLWLNKTLYSGYKFVISFKDLDELDPMFDTDLLAAKFSAAWGKTNKGSRHALAKACLRGSILPFLAMVLPRLCFTFFMFVQPFFIDAAASCLKKGTSLAEKSGVIGAAALIYMGVGVTRSLYTNMNSRFATVIRGMLMSAILVKPFSLPQNQSELSGAVTHMSTDMDGIVNGLPYLHELWINCVEFGIGLYLLATMVGAAAFLVAVPTFVTSAISWYVGERLPTARARWNERVEIRVAKTSTTLTQLKAMKMVGLEHIASRELEDLRNVEIEYSIKARVLACMVNMTVGICEVMTPTLVLAGAIFWTTFTGRLNAIDAFKTIAIIGLVTKPLKGAISCYSEVLSMFACGERVQKFVGLDEMEDQRQLVPNSPKSDIHHEAGEKGEKHEPATKASESEAAQPPAEKEANYAIRFADTTIAPRDDPRMPKVFAINLSIQEAEFLILSGATGAGKSLLLRSVLGETKITAGKLFVKAGAKGYCGQTLWIKNGSIKDNVVGFSPFDAAWYESVMHACLLRRDVARLPGGDDYAVGSNGANLSGGQKQRLAAARALYARTPFLILDDIFSSLDLPTADMMFHRVFGKDGLIRKWNPTIILTTHSKEYFPFADRVLVVGSDGLVTVRADVRSPEFLSQLRDTTCQNNGNAYPPGAAHANSSEEGQEKDVALEAPAEEEEGDRTRQQGDFGLYIFFLKTIGAVRTFIWLFLTISTVVIEKFPDVFLRIWLDRAPDNKLYFLGYALFSMSGCFIGTGMLIYWFSHAVPASLHTFHQMVLETIVKAKLSVLTGTDHGTLLSYFSQDITMASQTFPQIFMRFVYVFLFTLGSLIISLSATKFAAPVAPAIIVVVYFIQRYYLRTSRQIRHLDLEGKEPLYTHLTETIAGLEYIRGFEWEQQTLQRSYELLNTSQKPFYFMFAIQRWLALVIDLTACGIAVILLAISLNLSFSATEASLALSLVALITFSDDVNDVVQDWTNLETSLGAIARLRRLVKMTPVEANPEGDLPKQWPWNGEISFTNVVAKYDETKPGRPALDGIGVEIPGGAKIGITGRTGSGKSSILMALLNFLDYTGTIHIDGIEISTLPPHFVRSRISTVSQDLIDLEGTVRHNLCPWLLDGSEGMRNPDENVMITLLWRLELWDAVYQGGGLDVKMATLGLSQGQKQLMGIARSLLRRIATGTSLLLVDEATSNLDYETEKLVHEVIQETFADCTVITVSHRPEMLKSCNVILHIEDGKIALVRQPTLEAPPVSGPPSQPQAPPEVRTQAQELRRQRRKERERLVREEEQQLQHREHSELTESVRRRFRSQRRQEYIERQRAHRERQRIEDEEQRRLEDEQDRLWQEEQETRQSLHEETEREHRRNSEG